MLLLGFSTVAYRCRHCNLDNAILTGKHSVHSAQDEVTLPEIKHTDTQCDNINKYIEIGFMIL